MLTCASGCRWGRREAWPLLGDAFRQKVRLGGATGGAHVSGNLEEKICMFRVVKGTVQEGRRK